MDTIDIKQISLPQRQAIVSPKGQGQPQHKKGKYFVRGPLSWDWLARAGRLPGKAIQVAITIRLEASIKRTHTIKLSNKRLHEIGVNPYSKARALRSLEINGLVSVERHTGRSPVVTILEAQENA